MNCVNPRWLPQQAMYVPCGQCALCAQDRTRQWTDRLTHEFVSSKNAVFVTLTYSPEHLPEGATLVKRDVQLFFKRLRKDISNLLDFEVQQVSPHSKGVIKYYVCGEYGENGTERPHYHAMIFGLKNCTETKALINDAWGLGFTKTEPFTADRAYYVSGYTMKKQYGQHGKSLYGSKGVLPPFALMSKNLGLGYIQEHSAELKKNLTYRMKGKVRVVSRYMRKKLEISPETMYEYCKDYYAAQILEAADHGVQVDWFIEQQIPADTPREIFENLRKKALTQGYCHGKMLVSGAFLDYMAEKAKLKHYELSQRLRTWRNKISRKAA